MRFALPSLLASAAIAVATSTTTTTAASPAATLSVAWTSCPPAIESQTASSSNDDCDTRSSVVSFPIARPNGTSTHSTTSLMPTARPNATASHTAEVAGGAIPQQMKASVAGLLGFCIMGLVML